MMDAKRRKEENPELSVSSTAISPEEVKLLFVIGKGSFGTVYKGICRGKDVAIKIFEKQVLTPAEEASFLKEVAMIKNNPHPNIVQFLGACTIPQKLMIVTEFVQQGDLYELLITKKAKVSDTKRLRMALDVALGMNWLHESKPQFIHRDLKINNLLVDENFRIKICDFGFAQVKDKEYLQDKKGEGKGSPLWTAPEIFYNKPFNEKCDVYSFGLILWSIMAKDTPFNSIRTMDVLIQEVCVNRSRPQIPQNWIPRLKNLISQCWDHDPLRRPPFSTITTELREIILEMTITDPTDREFWNSTFGISDIDREFHDLNNFTVTLYKAIKRYNKIHTIQPEQVATLDDLCKLSDQDLYLFSAQSVDNAKAAMLEFMKRYGVSHNIESESNYDMRLFKILAETSERPDAISLERFGTLLKWFGPILDPRTNQMLLFSRMKWTIDFDWFHGDIDKEETEERLVRNSYLVRFSSSIPGQFTFSLMTNGHPTHIRIERVEQGFSMESKVCRTLGYLVKKYVQQQEQNLGITLVPCPGSSRYKRELLKGNPESGYKRSNYNNCSNDHKDDVDIVEEEDVNF